MKLVKILSDKVQIRSDYKEFDDVRINDLIAVSDGEVELVTMVNTLTDIDTENEEEIGENDYILEHSSTKMLECTTVFHRTGTMKLSIQTKKEHCFSKIINLIQLLMVFRWMILK